MINTKLLIYRNNILEHKLKMYKCDLCSKATERFDNCINDECHIHMVVCQECRDANKYIWCKDACRETGRLGKVRFRDMELI